MLLAFQEQHEAVFISLFRDRSGKHGYRLRFASWLAAGALHALACIACPPTLTPVAAISCVLRRWRVLCWLLQH